MSKRVVQFIRDFKFYNKHTGRIKTIKKGRFYEVEDGYLGELSNSRQTGNILYEPDIDELLDEGYVKEKKE